MRSPRSPLRQFLNAETNAGISTVERMLQEAADLQAWFNVGAPDLGRMRARTASFCAERSGHYDAFDQGISFFLPKCVHRLARAGVCAAGGMGGGQQGCACGLPPPSSSLSPVHPSPQPPPPAA